MAVQGRLRLRSTSALSTLGGLIPFSACLNHAFMPCVSLSYSLTHSHSSTQSLSSRSLSFSHSSLHSSLPISPVLPSYSAMVCVMHTARFTSSSYDSFMCDTHAHSLMHAHAHSRRHTHVSMLFLQCTRFVIHTRDHTCMRTHAYTYAHKCCSSLVCTQCDRFQAQA